MQVDTAKKRVKWLQDRLEKVLLATRSYSGLHPTPVTGGKVTEYFLFFFGPSKSAQRIEFEVNLLSYLLS